jgi:cytoskeletal protein RodZ
MTNEAKNLGELLKRRRQELNLSLKEAENATSIRIHYLQSVEDGKPENLISPIYSEGFVKQYATYLGLDGEKIIKENPQVFKRGIKQEFDYGIGTLEVRDNPGTSVKWLPNGLWVALIAALVFGGWYLGKFFGIF